MSQPQTTACTWCRRTDTDRVPVNSTIGGKAERCADADDCMEAKSRREESWIRGH